MNKPAPSFFARRFSPQEVFGLHLTIGVAVLLVASALFGVLAENVVTHARITQVDVEIAQRLHRLAASRWTGPMLAITQIHSTPGLLLLASLLSGYFYRQRRRAWMLTLLATVPGGMILNVLLKTAFHRARPSFDDPLVNLATYSFPSGHALGATVFYGTVAAFLMTQARTGVQRVLIGMVAVLMVLLVAFTRLYLGAHYLSDVLAGMVEGIAWLAICLSAGATLRRARAAKLSIPI